MSNPSTDAVRARPVDEALRTYMNKVYGLMAAAMAVTGAVAYGISTNEDLIQAIYGTSLRWVVMLAPLGVVILLSARLHKMSAAAAQMTFWIFSALVGASISYIFIVYTGISITRVFFITSCAFLGLSLYGYTTKRDLSGMGSFLVMGLIGLIVASVVNIFLQSSALHFAVSAIGVLVFAGFTAYDTQQIRKEFLGIRHAGGEVQSKAAIMGALRLYLDFLNLFIFIMQFMGVRK